MTEITLRFPMRQSPHLFRTTEIKPAVSRQPLSRAVTGDPAIQRG
jgi:hypothetical protein